MLFKLNLIIFQYNIKIKEFEIILPLYITLALSRLISIVLVKTFYMYLKI